VRVGWPIWPKGSLPDLPISVSISSAKRPLWPLGLTPPTVEPGLY